MTRAADVVVCGLGSIGLFMLCVWIMEMCKAAAKPAPPTPKAPEDIDESFIEQEKRTR